MCNNDLKGGQTNPYKPTKQPNIVIMDSEFHTIQKSGMWQAYLHSSQNIINCNLYILKNNVSAWPKEQFYFS